MDYDMRLDFIKNINKETIDEMSALRALYILLDNNLRIINNRADNQGAAGCSAYRALCNARHNLEMSLFYAMKSLSLLGEEHGS